MKKRYLFLLIILVIGGGIWFLTGRVDMNNINNGKVIFKYVDKNILTDLSEKDLNTIKDIFNNKKLWKGNLSCGFTEDVAILLNDGSQVYCIACDTCPFIYYKNKDKYFTLTDEENTIIRNLLEKYGFHFPCV